METEIKVAAVQLNSTPELADNLSRALALCESAAADGAQLIVLPECFAYLGPGNGKLEVAEALPPTGAPGPILTACAELARRCQVELVLGGFWEKSADPHRVHNASVHLDAKGQVRSVYRKLHLFDVDLPDGTRLRESDSQVPGEEVVVTDTVAGKLGMSICFDLRFPVLYQELVRAGARLLSVPAAFTETTGKDHWHPLLRARAIETQCYVIAAAQTGLHFGKRRSYGHALICDPWGTILAECGAGEGVALARIRPSYVDEVRASVPMNRKV